MTYRSNKFVANVSMKRGERGIVSDKALEEVLRGYAHTTKQFLKKMKANGTEPVRQFIREHEEELCACFCGVLGHSLASLRGLGENTVTGYELRLALAQGKDEISAALPNQFPDVPTLPIEPLQRCYYELVASIDAELIKPTTRKR